MRSGLKFIALRRVIWLHRRVSLFGKIKKPFSADSSTLP
ncbi:hypothetical protein HMPREF1144_0279 [Klebsiella sp. OBRC7]|nr:hypothetical protein HMPREF1144_0279 [Klebsiella sp. OBRC7]